MACREELKQNNQPYPRYSCEDCGSLLRPGWRCAYEGSSFSEHATVKQEGVLGKQTGFPTSPDDPLATLVAIPFNRKLGDEPLMAVRLSCPEFTSLCPITGQPDFAHIVIDYVPTHSLVESKSLKLFMGSFRNHGAYHEKCTAQIGARIMEAIKPEWLRVSAYWYPRGGIPIDVFIQSGEPPKGAHIPPIDIPVYRAR